MDRQQGLLGALPRRDQPLIPVASGRTLAASWLAHPSELIASLLFLCFLVLSAGAYRAGRPDAHESLRLTSLYASLWFLWIAGAVFVVPASWRWLQTLRGIGPWIAVMLSYNLVRYLIPAVHPARMDAPLRKMEIDWGLGSAGWTHALNRHPHWTDLFCAIYLSLFVWMVAYVLYHLFFRKELHQRFMLGFVLIYAGGFLGYMLCPAIGPRYAYASEWTWLSGGFGFALCNRTVANMGAQLDAFPSLHAALSLYLLSWQIGHHRRNLVWGLPLAIGIWLSTIFLGFHYAPDLVAGGLLGLGSLGAAALLERRFRVLSGSLPSYYARAEAPGGRRARRISGEERAGGGAKPAGETMRASAGTAAFVERMFFRFSSAVTERWPRLGARFFDGVVRPMFGSRLLVARARWRNRRIVARLESADRILVVSDMHIGDAIYTQGAVSAVRDFFPESSIDYAVHHAVAPLIEGNPEIDRVLRVFTGKMLPSPADLVSLGALMDGDTYDFYLNFSPFFIKAGVYHTKKPLLDIHTHSHELAYNEMHAREVPNHFLYQMHHFVRSLLAERFEAERPARFPRVSIYLREAARARARKWLAATGWRSPAPLVLLNPDAASPYTQIPESIQADLLERLVRDWSFVLIGEGSTNRGVGWRLQRSLPRRLARSTAVVPAELPLEVYAALIDSCDLFISGDTGPLHIAAARKVIKDGPGRFANRTAVFSIFGATPPRMSGYDDQDPGYLPADQDAPSATFISMSPCRNITCVNKMLKTCAVPRCFASLDTVAIAARAREVLAGERRNAAAEAGLVSSVGR